MPDPTTIGQRFTQLIQQLGLSKNAFAQSLDRTATVIQHLVDERNKPGYDLLCRVFEVYPNVSKGWLLLGQGSMLLDAATPSLSTAGATQPADEAIDIATVLGPPRRRATSASLQPAEVAATVALAAAQAAQAVAQPASPEPAVRTAEPASVAAPPGPVLSNVPQPVFAPAPVPAAPSLPLPVAPDPAYLAALLQAQHVQHQLALSEQRNQHLLEQQQLLQQMVQLLQKSA